MTESKKYPGFYHIPGFHHYVLSKDGALINEITGHTIKATKNSSGYVIFPRLLNDHGAHRQLSRARALCTTFKETEMANFLQVDHVNCIHDDDRLENLEWVTPKENCRRAAANGLYRGAHAVVVRNFYTKKETIYPSMAAAARAFGMTKDQMQYRLEMNDGRVYPEGNQYQFVDKLTNWTDVEDVETDIESFGVCKKVLVNDLRSGEIREFGSAREAASFLKANESTLSEYLSDGSQRILPGFFLAKRCSDKTEWRVVEDPVKTFLEEQTYPAVCVTDSRTGKRMIYFSQFDCAKDFKLLPSTLNYRLKYGKPDATYPDGFQYKYFDPNDDSSTTSELSRRLLAFPTSEMPLTRIRRVVI